MGKQRPFHGFSGALFFIAALLCATALAFALYTALYPGADGTNVYTDDTATVDMSHTDQGYVMVSHVADTKQIKIRFLMGENSSTYDLRTDGEYDTFPLVFGDGDYEIQIFRQVSGKRYTQESTVNFSVFLSEDTIPFLYPNQYVWYTEQNNAVVLAAQLCADLTTDAQRLAAVRDYVVTHIQYDTELAKTVQSGYIPVIDDVLAAGKGICFDYSSLTAAMLRSQGVPTQLVIGYADTIYHAWNNVWIDGQWQRIDTTAEASNVQVKQYTEERIY